MQTNNIFIILFLLLFSCSTDETTVEQTPSKATYETIKVETQIIQKKNFNTEIPANGKITALKQAELYFKTSGTIKEIRVQNGSFVKKGDIIAILENDLQKNKLKEAENNLAKSEIERSILMVEYDVKRKSDQREKLMQNIDTKSGYLQALTALEAAQLYFDYTFLKAPFSGTIANLKSQEWNNTPTGEKFCFLLDDSKLKLEFNILESEFALVKVGQSINIQPIYNDTLNFIAQINEIDPIVNENGLITVKALLEKKSAPFLFSGMNVKVSIKEKLKNVLPIPKSALVKRSGKDVVFTVKNNRAYWNYVEIAAENSDSYAVKKGLKLGDTIIISNNIQLAHDAKIQITMYK